MDLEFNSEGGSGGPTSVCSDQLFDACGAEPVPDFASRGVVGWAQPRTSSIAQLRERLRARQKVRVEVPKLHDTSGCAIVMSQDTRHRKHLEPLWRIFPGLADTAGLVIDGWVED